MLAVLAGLGTVVVLHLVDLVTGAHLEWNTVFGYSPTIGIRFVGQGNMTFSQLTAAAVLFAGLLAWQVPTRRGVRVAVATARGHRDRDGRRRSGATTSVRVLSARPGFALLGVAAARAPSCVAHGVGAGRCARVAAGVVVGLARPAAPARPAHPRGQVLREGRHRLRRRHARAAAQGGREPLGARALVAARLPHRDRRCWWPTSGASSRGRCARWSRA